MEKEDNLFGIILVFTILFCLGLMIGKVLDNTFNTTPKAIDTQYCTEPCSMYDSRPECEVGK